MSYAACPTDIIAAPIDIVWHLLITPEEWGAFYDVRIVEVVPPGPAKVGQKIRGVTGPLGLQLAVTFEFLVIDPAEHRLVVDVRLPFGIEVHEDLDARPVDASRCRVSYHCGFDFPRGWRGALMRMVLRRELDQGPVDSLARLKREAEQRYSETGQTT
jgi:hypothetical protein